MPQAIFNIIYNLNKTGTLLYNYEFTYMFACTVNIVLIFNSLTIKFVQQHLYLLWRCLTYLLTYSMVQSPSWEANWFAASQEIPRILWNPKVHYRTRKPPPPVRILSQPSAVHIPTSHLLENHLNIIHASTARSPQWSLSLLLLWRCLHE